MDSVFFSDYNLCNKLLRDPSAYGVNLVNGDGHYFFAVYLAALFWLSLSYRRGEKKTLLGLLNLNGSDVFIEFLDKFGRGIDVKIACGFRRKWWIEYDILTMAYQWYKRDPVGSQEAFRKARNKKELRLILGVS